MENDLTDEQYDKISLLAHKFLLDLSDTVKNNDNKFHLEGVLLGIELSLSRALHAGILNNDSRIKMLVEIVKQVTTLIKFYDDKLDNKE